jgi:hypothetical protein
MANDLGCGQEDGRRSAGDGDGRRAAGGGELWHGHGHGSGHPHRAGARNGQPCGTAVRAAATAARLLRLRFTRRRSVRLVRRPPAPVGGPVRSPSTGREGGSPVDGERFGCGPADGGQLGRGHCTGNRKPAQTPLGTTSGQQRLRGDYAFALLVADAFDSYDVFVDSKKFTSCRVSFAAAIHFAGFETL